MWSFLRKFWRSNESRVHTEEHESLDDEDKIIEDILEISAFIFRNEGWKNIERIECNDGYECLAYFHDGSKKEYQLDWYLRKDQDMKERMNEIEILWSQSDTDYISEELEIKSHEFFN